MGIILRPQNSRPMKKIVVAVAYLIAILTFGTLGYMVIEGGSFLDSLFMTVITITTVGYREIIPIGTNGKLFTIMLIFIGVGFVLYMFGKVTEAMVEGGLRTIFGRKNMKKMVAGIKDHYIVCGFGRIGKVICQILHENNRAFVVIENDAAVAKSIEEMGYLVLEGQATEDEMLLQAGILRAKGLISVVSSDADNVYIILSAKGLKPDLYILTRSSGEDGVENKLLRAGASKVISPYYIGATRMAQLIVRPTVIDFIDLAVHGGELGLRLEELSVSNSSVFVNKTLSESDIRKDFDLIVVAIKRDHGKMIFNPNQSTMILSGDVLVVMGEYDNIHNFKARL